MAQHDYSIADQNGASFRSDLNSALSAIVSNNSGATEPATTYAHQWWVDTTAGILKRRNAANDGWISVMSLTTGLIIGTNVQAYSTNIPTVLASQAEMEAGTEAALRSMSPLRVAQAIAALGSAYTDADVLSLFSVSGLAPVYACRAWVNFNGQGTVAIRASGNVSSITDNGTGDYTVNFTNAMPDTDYGISGFAGVTGATSSYAVFGGTNHVRNTTSTRIQTATSAVVDPSTVCVQIFR